MDKIIILGTIGYSQKATSQVKKISTLFNENMTIEEYKLNFEKQTKEAEGVESAELISLQITENDENGKTKLKANSKEPVLKSIFQR